MRTISEPRTPLCWKRGQSCRRRSRRKRSRRRAIASHATSCVARTSCAMCTQPLRESSAGGRRRAKDVPSNPTESKMVRAVWVTSFAATIRNGFIHRPGRKWTCLRTPSQHGWTVRTTDHPRPRPSA